MQTIATNMDFLIREPAVDYHEQAGNYLSSHLLADFRKCPQLYRKKQLGLIRDEDRPAYVVGRAAHTLILEGNHRFEQEYAVGGPINPKTGKPFGSNTKAWAEWAASIGKPILTDEQYGLISQLNHSVHAHPVAAELLVDGVAEGVVRTDYCGRPCQIRMDWLSPHQGIVDLKTADDLTWFESDAKRYGYAHQLAFYRAVLSAATGWLMAVYLIGVEKKEPFRAGVWRISDDTLAIAQQENEAAVERLRRCEETDTWPTGYEEVRLFDAA